MPSYVPVTGLTMMGQALAQGSGDYANRRLSLADEARRRNERLTDVESQRLYEEQRIRDLNSLQMQNEQRRRGEANEDLKTRQTLELAGQMRQEALRRGLLSPQDIGNQEAEAVAAAALTEQLRAEGEFAAGQPGQAAQSLEALGAQEQVLRQKLSQLEAKLSSQPTIDPRAVQARAIEIATANAGGGTPSREQIAEAAQTATREIQEQAFAQWYQDKQDATVQYQILSNQLNTLRQQQATLIGTFRVAPSIQQAQPPPVTQAAAPAPQGGNPMAAFLDELNKSTPPPRAESPIGAINQALSMAPPEAQPILRQARTSQLADLYEQLDEPIAATQAELAQTQQALTRATSGLNPWQGVQPGAFPGNPQAQGEAVTRLLMRQAALENQLAEQRAARGAGKTQALSGLQLNTPSQFVPVQPPSPGSVLSTR